MRLWLQASFIFGPMIFRHGTRCAGEVAAEANNGVCSTGVAYEASIGGKVSYVVSSYMCTFNSEYIIHIMSCIITLNILLVIIFH